MGMYPGGDIIRVTPTVVASSAYADADVLFAATKIPNAVSSRGGVSKLISAYVIDQAKQDVDYDIYIFENSTSLGTIDLTANIADDDFVAGNLCGVLHVDHDQTETQDLDNLIIHRILSMDGGTDAAASNAYPMMLKAAAGSTDVYMSAIITSGTPTFDAIDDLQFIFHIEYLN
tara:strand:- start:29 stop:550 length:522 start_codon:yes stop_codon:yes gene_type:complete